MGAGILAKLRNARRIEIYCLIIIAAAFILLASNGQVHENNEAFSLEARLENILASINGVKNVDAMITQHADEGEIIGVLIVAEGMNGMNTYLEIQSAVKTLLNIELSQIKIIYRE